MPSENAGRGRGGRRGGRGQPSGRRGEVMRRPAAHKRPAAQGEPATRKRPARDQSASKEELAQVKEDMQVMRKDIMQVMRKDMESMNEANMKKMNAGLKSGFKGLQEQLQNMSAGRGSTSSEDSDKVSKEEFRKALGTIGRDRTLADKIFSRFDPDDTGVLDMQTPEFCAYFEEGSREVWLRGGMPDGDDAVNNVVEVFRSEDTDDSGTLSKEDRKRVLIVLNPSFTNNTLTKLAKDASEAAKTRPAHQGQHRLRSKTPDAKQGEAAVELAAHMEVRCRDGHPLKAHVSAYECECDCCSAKIAVRDVALTCFASCDYDMCQSCFKDVAANLAHEPHAASTKKQEQQRSSTSSSSRAHVEPASTPSDAHNSAVCGVRDADKAMDQQFICQCLCDDGRVCGKEFDTNQKLQTHIRSKVGGTHMGKKSRKAELEDVPEIADNPEHSAPGTPEVEITKKPKFDPVPRPPTASGYVADSSPEPGAAQHRRPNRPRRSSSPHR